MLLLIDQGNTRAKFQLRDKKGAIAASFNLNNLEIPEARFSDNLKNISRIVVASVANTANKLWLTSFLQTFIPDVKIDFAVTGKSFDLVHKVVTNSYTEVSQMGIDRWLATIAAADYCRAENCVVVDLGSAITVELINANGAHEGGYIIPGMQMMLKSLFADTAQVKVPNLTAQQNLNPGKNTASCVSSGILNAVVGIIHRSVAQLVELSPNSPTRVLLTGGDVALIESNIDIAEKKENLVFDGLYLWQNSAINGRGV